MFHIDDLAFPHDQPRYRLVMEAALGVRQDTRSQETSSLGVGLSVREAREMV